MDQPIATHCGNHSVHSDGNLLIVEFIGQLEMPEFVQIRALGDRLISRYGGIYFLAHVQHAQGITPEVRRAIVSWFKSRQVHGIVNINAATPIRALITLLTTGARLLLGVATPMVILGTEQEARAWVEEKEKHRR
jgi:hypothetical protein